MFDLIIQGGQIVGSDKIYEATIAVKEGKIAAIADPRIKLESTKIINADKKMIFPGAIDCHGHLNEPGFEWREDFSHGSEAAAAGGVTTIIDMPLQNTPALTNKKAFLKKESIIRNKSVVDYAFWGGLVDNNLLDLIDLKETGTVGFKAFLGPVSPDYSTVSLGMVREAMNRTKDINTLFGFHCEDYGIIKNAENNAKVQNRYGWEDYLETRPVIAELIAVKNVIEIVKETGVRAHICHVSHPIVANEIKKAQDEELQITGETCPHYLIFSKDNLISRGALFKCAPPLRDIGDKEGLWKFVINGTLSCIASDHSPCTWDEKNIIDNNSFKSWGGISGIQTMFQVMFNEVIYKRKLSPTLLTKVLSQGPAKVFNLYPRKGSVSVGADADFIVVDPEKEWEITKESLFYKNKISAFVGLKGKGLPVQTIVRGEVVYNDGIINAKHGYGILIKPLKERFNDF